MKCAIAHIADIHYRREELEGASLILDALVTDLAKQKETLTDYDLYLAITGDVVFAGNDVESYLSFGEKINRRLSDIGLARDHLMIVPGNHDIDQAIVKKDFENYRATMNSNSESERKFNDFIEDTNYRDDKFDNYMLFEADFAQYGIDYSVTGKGWVLNSDLGVYCLNTSLSSLGRTNHVVDEPLAVFTRGLIDWCNTTNTSINVLLMHHPLSSLNKWSRSALKQVIETHFSLCLCGHAHEQDIFYNNISQKSLICSAPQVFTNREDLLGYAIVLIEYNSVDKIIYREYAKGQFLNGQRFSENSQGVVNIQSDRLKLLDILKSRLRNALSFFRGQPEVFIEPKISKEREFNNEPNLLDELIKAPRASFIVSHPQFGLTCLSHYMRLEAYKNGSFWVYLDSKHTKARNVEAVISSQLREFNRTVDDIACIIIDSWDCSVIDHRNILKSIDGEYKGVPVLVMSNYTTLYYAPEFNFDHLNTEYDILHLQAMQRNKVREFVSQYNKEKRIAGEDVIVEKVVKDLEALNIHRTPFNCLTLLKVLERNYNESFVNRTKMIKAVLFILFTDADSFTYSSNKPDVDDCEYILGKFCMGLINRLIIECTQAA
jgi:predicted MPP superfamily phosphohydrolase